MPLEGSAVAPISLGGGELTVSEPIQDARSYHRPRYRALVADIALGVAALSLLAFSAAGDGLYRTVDALPWWAAAPLLAFLAVGLSALVRLPVALWRDVAHERRFGLSTQTVAGFAGDRLKTLVVGGTLAAGSVLGLTATVHAAPSAWLALAAPGAALLVVGLSFVAPVLLEPIFNRFHPLADTELAEALRTFASRAGVPVRDVLVADASRRTRKVNAYVSGLGSTRRVVLFDTLVERATLHELEIVVAHELGHRRYRHVAQETVLAMSGAAGLAVALWGLVHWDGLLAALGASGPGDPRIAPFLLLLATVAGLAAAPFQSALSRHWEYECDRFALEQVGDLAAFESAFALLSKVNLADPAPPRPLYLWLFTHPTVPERLEAARRVARSATVPA